MRSWRIMAADSPAILCDMPLPRPGPGQALVRIHACALNFADLLMAKGTYQKMPPYPFTPGLEWAGQVEALGSGCGDLAVGTRVACAQGYGGLADHGCFDAEHLIPLPAAMPYDHAAGFLIAYGTAHLALIHKARLAPNETLFVTGAAGGVGLTAVEVGARLGARVVASARGADRLALAQAAGASVVIDSEAPDLTAQLQALGGVDVVYDTVGGPAFDSALRATQPDGRLLCIGFASGTVPQVKLNHLLVKNLSVIGFWWGGYHGFAPQLLRDSLAALFDWYLAGDLRPHTHMRLPLDCLPEGMEMLRNRQASGKIIITP